MKMTQQIIELVEKGAIFYISHSGGKDSQAMYIQLLQAIPHDQIVVVHASLGDVEWPGAIEHIQDTTEHDLNVVQAKKTFFDMVESRGMFPSARYRQCTSDLKRGPIQKFIRNDMKRRGGGIAVNCMGLRAEESASRAKRQPLKLSKSQTVKGRVVWDWLPIFEMTKAEVFAVISNAWQEPHWAYKTGNERFSCVFCIMGSLNDLQNGALQNPELYHRYVEIERRKGHTMFMKGGKPIWLDDYVGIPVKNLEVTHG